MKLVYCYTLNKFTEFHLLILLTLVTVPYSLYCGKCRKVSKLCSDLDLDWTMPNKRDKLLQCYI